ncbi:MAG: SpoVR family protein [Bdellovibrionales bacterium CG10_big_fil_rev_8_21_14_0_10_45_34]|nr:MAG: SpoVR family protein [Bdellovibrionales bacterium CG10_big_fil_rev_8_21_14_0_10_45_34]
MGHLTPELEKARIEIEKMARDYGLDFFETIFELITFDEMNQFAAFGGFPVRYPHWRFGMEYESLSKGYEYGLSKIYEMVINTDPCYAYLMEGNMFVDQKLVMAHVYGHCDFFKNNQWFAPTNRKMMDVMANHATRIRRYIDRYGIEAVERFIDRCLSLENLIDRYAPYSKSATKDLSVHEPELSTNLLKDERPYMKDFLRPKAKKKSESQDEGDEALVEKKKFPERPERDVLLFLLQNAPLEIWQQDVLSIIRDEAYYFVPQGMTKIMNEGWASFWHSKMMTQNILSDTEVVDYADHHSGTVAMNPQGFNPYKIGIELFRNIETRWDRGQFGKVWTDCEDLVEKKRWDKRTGLGRQKIFEVRRNYNDVTFIDEFLTEEFCVENKMFVYKFNKSTGRYEIDTRDFPKIKKQFLFHLTNFGQPIIEVEDANFENRGELLLRHVHEGVDMQPNFMAETMKNLQSIWTRPVNVATVMDGDEKIFKFDGKEYKEFTLKELPGGKA